jgi:gluconokinase
MLVVVMGVAGSGKTTVGRALAAALGAAFVEADDCHSPANVARMRAGIPLDDEARAPWLRAVRGAVLARLPAGPVVLACSALKAAYRDVLLEGIPGSAVVFLRVDPPVLERRLRERTGHYMPATLLASQLADLEAPRDAIVVDGDAEPGVIVADVRRALAERD